MMSTLGIDFDLSDLGTAGSASHCRGLGCPLLGFNLFELARRVDLQLRGGMRQLGLLAWLGLVVPGLVACQSTPSGPVRKIVMQQSWQLGSGDFVAGYAITGGLGDITVDLNHNELRAPFQGKVELAAQGFQCIYYSTPEIPAYLFRYCGVKHPRPGSIAQGQRMGQGDLVHFATLRRMPDGTWAVVEPSSQVLEKTLVAP
jgi:hypothetical protein